MTIVELKDGRIECDVPHREKSLIQMVPGAKWHNATLRWRAPLSWATCKALRGVFADKLTVGPALEKWAWEELADRIEPSMMWRAAALDLGHDPSGNNALYPHQRSAVHFLRAAGSALLGDEMGVGKTPTVCVALDELDAWPALIVCPKSMQYTWAREIEKWTTVNATVLAGSAVQRRKQFESWPDTGALVVSYDLLRVHSRLAPYGSIALSAAEKTPGELNAVAWRAVVADEVHRAKDAKAKQTRALWAVGDKAEHRFALTGTPIANNIGDLWALLRFVSPEEWPARTTFLERYAQVSLNYWGGMEILGIRQENEAEFRSVLEPRFLRRTKDLVLPHLPPKTYERRDVEMSVKQKKAYRQLADGMVAELESGTLVTFSPLVQGMRLSQFASAMCEVEDTGEVDENGTPVQRVRMTEPSPKLDVLDEILEGLGEAACAVFASSRQLLDLAWTRMEKAGISAVRMVGGQHPLERQDALDQYNRGEARVILISLGAGAEGVSLTRGSTEVFLDRSWSAVQNKQSEDRLHGTGRGEAGSTKLTIIDLVTAGTIEEARAEALVDKAEALEELVQDRELLKAALRFGSK